MNNCFYDVHAVMNFYRELEKAYRTVDHLTKQMIEERRESTETQLPPAGLTMGKTIIPRARRNLPQGVRNRFGKQEV